MSYMITLTFLIILFSVDNNVKKIIKRMKKIRDFNQQ